ncbi:hypothetical protein GIB67_029146 [Kingdonia uniflora]|uniref:Acyl carrier protein n=1 Tax=Kingdonia uniflora TaxID=39325 RepID=A0A7J7N3U4_9MAGN|nr:hypothetical protein GIB67_029146 [Kingdonia uniflora]
MAASAVRNALLKNLRVNVVVANPNNTSFGVLLRRHFSDEIRGSFLDKHEVSDRIISVVKNFQKVDPSKLGMVRNSLELMKGWNETKQGTDLECKLLWRTLNKRLGKTVRLIPTKENVRVVDKSKECKIQEVMVTPNAHFQNDLGLDSLDTVEVVMALEEEFQFEIPDNEADKINSINLAVDFIASHPQAK